MACTSSLTDLLHAHADGDRDAFGAVWPLIYDPLRQIAHHRLRGERLGHTLSTTGLVHEAYLKLVDFDRIDWKGRAHFLALASQAMRNILVDYAAKRNTQKRGGEYEQVSLTEAAGAVEAPIDLILDLSLALDRLEALDERQARVVECRSFGGLTIEETAEALGISAATVSRDWAMARAWLNLALSGSPGRSADDRVDARSGRGSHLREAGDDG